MTPGVEHDGRTACAHGKEAGFLDLRRVANPTESLLALRSEHDPTRAGLFRDGHAGERISLAFTHSLTMCHDGLRVTEGGVGGYGCLWVRERGPERRPAGANADDDLLADYLPDHRLAALGFTSGTECYEFRTVSGSIGKHTY
ncbi:hypothetical protein [Ferrimicrobium sp.]|uniref:hypothetical protein n=1 Tax=Ferrimicrobium sp. TaxID=2926050 RepID=UPI0026378024|nr:hypothetical protein [Ferrimicrobium sp.]